MEQLNGLVTQVSALTRLTTSAPFWLLVDTYIDIASGKKANRKAFKGIIQCQRRLGTKKVKILRNVTIHIIIEYIRISINRGRRGE